MKKPFLFTLIATLAFSSFSFAQSQKELNDTAAREYKNADADLNSTYKRLLGILSQSDKNLLIAAEKDWLKYRDSHCKFEGKQYQGGSMQPMIINNCLAETTRQRTAQLNTSFSDRN